LSYRACFDCELIFEVDDAPGVESMVCPQCEQLLEAYQPEAEELSVEQAAEAAADDGAIAATMAFDGLSDAVQSRIDNEIQRPEPTPAPPAVPSETPTGEHQAVAVAPVERKPFPEATHRPRPRFGQSPTTGNGSGSGSGRAGGGKTRVLEAVDDLAQLDDAEALGIEPELAPTVPVVPEMAPTAMLDVSLPPMPPKGTGEHPIVSRDPALNFPTMPPPSKPPRRTGLWIALAVLVLGGGGAGAWFMLNGSTSPKPKPATQAPTKPVPQTWTARIEAQLDAGEAKLPVVSGLEPAEELGVFIAGGPEGLMTSVGPVTGLPATRVRSDILDSDVDGHWVRPLVQTLARAKADASEPFSMALDTNVTTKDLLRIAYGAFKHGHQSFNLLVGRTDGGLGALGFKLHFNSYPEPAKAVVLRIGRTRGFHLTVQAEGKVISQEPRLLPRRDTDGKLDLRALSDRLDQLVTAHPGVGLIIVHPLPSMPLDKLAAVLTRIRGRGAQPRFTDLRLLVR
jgi:hypothetical protein